MAVYPQAYARPIHQVLEPRNEAGVQRRIAKARVNAARRRRMVRDDDGRARDRRCERLRDEAAVQGEARDRVGGRERTLVAVAQPYLREVADCALRILHRALALAVAEKQEVGP